MLNKIRYGDGSLAQDIQLESGMNGNENSELQAILTPSDLGVCLLRDSPYRILRVSCFFNIILCLVKLENLLLSYL